LNLALLIPSLGCGGAERVLQLLAGGFHARGHRVSVITTTRKDDFYELPAGVGRLRLDLTGQPPGRGALPRQLPRSLASLARSLPRLRSALEATSPHLVVGFLGHANLLALLLSSRGRRWPVVVTEHSHPRLRELGPGGRALRRLLYPRAACVVSVSPGVDAQFGWLPPERRAVISNPVEVDVGAAHAENGRAPESPIPGRFAVAMGRLDRAKGFDLLLAAFARLRERFPDWHLALLGDGPEHAALVAQAEALGLGQRVVFLGARRDPFAILARADLFVLPSRLEGFGNVLVEAMACGLPVVSFDCPSGPAQIVAHRESGLLVPAEDVPALAEAMATLMSDADERARMGRAAREASQRFRLDTVLDAWEQRVLPLAGPRGQALRARGKSTPGAGP